MTAPSSIDPTRFLHEQLGSASPDLLRSMLTTFMNTPISAEPTRSAAPPTASRARNARTCARLPPPRLSTPARAPSMVAIPKLREGSYYPDWLLERRRRAERALTTVVATCYLLGVSTRRMEKLVDALEISPLSKS